MARLADTLKRPQLGEIEAGRMPKVKDLKSDALGRRMVKLNEVPKNFGDYKPQGGTPQQKGVETFIPRALEAAQRVGVPAHMVTRKPTLTRLFANRMGRGTPGPLNETIARMLQMKRGGML